MWPPRSRLPSAALVALAALAATPVARAQFQDFAGWTGIDVGTPAEMQFAQEFLRADFDGDGHADLAVVSWGLSQHKLAILKNLGDERFGPATFYPLLKGSQALAAADIDGDGDLDLGVTEGESASTGTTVAIFRNAGDASFSLSQRLTVPKGPLGIAACDYDGDGDKDFAVAIYGVSASGTSVKLLVNNGAGSFSSGASISVSAAPACLAAADFNGDGRDDLAVGHDKFDVITILLGGGANFAAPIVFNVSAGMAGGSSLFSCINVADLDKDGDLDIAFSDNSHQKFIPFLRGLVSTIRNQGGGAFVQGPDIVLRPGANGFTDMAFADLNADGWPDVLGTDHQDWDFALSDGAGGFVQPLVTNYGFLGTDEPTAIDAFDADRDGDLDALVLGSHSVALSVHRFQAGVPQEGTTWLGPDGDLDAADIDGDGDLDLAGGGGGPIHVLRNLGDGSFGPEVTYPSGAFGGPKAVKLRDLDGDNFPDLVIVTLGGFNTKLNLGDGNFGPLVQWNLPSCGQDDIDLLDLDEDGDLDVVVAESAGCPSVPFPRVWVIESNGDGTFVQPNAPAFLPSGLTTTLAHADLNLDGHLDLVLAQNSWLEVYLGDGTLTGFAPKLIAPAAWAPHGIVAADFNADGLPDLASCNWGGSGNDFINETLSVLLGHGDGTFAPPAVLPAGASWDLGSTSAIQAGDLDRDGDTDLLVANYDSHDVSLYRNAGDGSFLPQTRVGGALYLTDAVLADFTGDGIGDLALAGQSAIIAVPGVTLLAGLGNDPWLSVGAALAGSDGLPHLDLDGALVQSATLSLRLVKAKPGAAGFHIIGLGLLQAPFSGGVLVPTPDILLPFIASASGENSLSAPLPLTLPAGTQLVMQSWIVDPAGPAGRAASNGVHATAP